MHTQCTMHKEMQYETLDTTTIVQGRILQGTHKKMIKRTKQKIDKNNPFYMFYTEFLILFIFFNLSVFSPCLYKQLSYCLRY